MNQFVFLFQSAGALVQFLPIVLIFGVFYFLLIVPQRKRQRQLQELISNLKAGDRVVTTGGVIGTVTALREKSLTIRSAEKSMLEISRSAVAGLQSEDNKS